MDERRLRLKVRCMRNKGGRRVGLRPRLIEVLKNGEGGQLCARMVHVVIVIFGMP